MKKYEIEVKCTQGAVAARKYFCQRYELSGSDRWLDLYDESDKLINLILLSITDRVTITVEEE